MFDFETPYYDMYKTNRIRIGANRPTVLHRKTCPVCDQKLVNVYYSEHMKKYICKACINKLKEPKFI